MNTRIQIVFDNPLGTYYTGQCVTGRIVIKLFKEAKFRGIQIKYLGEARVGWSKKLMYRNKPGVRTGPNSYTSRERHLDKIIFVAGGSDGEITLSPGEYTYPFSLVLPPTIPSSFEGDHGYVRYTVKGKIIRPWKFDHECKAAFTVLNILDLNGLPTLLNSVRITRENYVYCCCSSSGPITIVFTVPHTGFVPGQTIQSLVEIDNLANECITAEVLLYQHVQFRATFSSRVVEKCIARQRIGIVDGKGSKTFPSNLLVPAVPVSYLQYCNIMNIYYFLKFVGNDVNGSEIARINVPVVIGSIPLRNQFSSIVPPAEHCTAFIPTAPPEFSDAYPDIAPPSYEECVQNGKVNIRSEDDSEHVQGLVEFSPRYPVYRFTENGSQN